MEKVRKLVAFIISARNWYLYISATLWFLFQKKNYTLSQKQIYYSNIIYYLFLDYNSKVTQ